MTNDEIAERIKYVTMDEGDGVPGARFAREMAEEVLQLRAELALLRPLAEAAVAWEAVEKSSGVVRAYKLLSLKQAALAYARAQAQAGEGA